MFFLTKDNIFRFLYSCFRAMKFLKIINFLDDLDDVQEVHTNAEFPDNFNKEE